MQHDDPFGVMEGEEVHPGWPEDCEPVWVCLSSPSCLLTIEVLLVAEPPVFCHRYTMGGFYLARYSDSPVGQFDEASRRMHADAYCMQLAVQGCPAHAEHDVWTAAAGRACRAGLECSHIMRMGSPCVCQQLVSAAGGVGEAFSR